MLAGSGSPGIGELFAVVSGWGGLAETRVLLRGVGLPSPQATLLNTSMGHALDFDDTLDTGGSNVTGKELLLAVAPGLDVSCRIALASTVDRGWHRTAAMASRSGGQAAAPDAVGRIRHRLLETLADARELMTPFTG
jgi:2-methylcitrate dehydratase PrpD